MKITEAAARQILLQANENDARNLGLRIAAKRMEDGGIDYAMGFDEQHDADAVYNKHGVTLFISPASQDLLDKATLDYVELDEGDRQFVFHNPLDPNYVEPENT
ncbi:MAG: iron-sulfur cluster assembly accessory protein [Proteobacteria bacterium]|nr:iron-sulfur cluster assembly accessory protein [Pseudomonadota bacterium]